MIVVLVDLLTYNLIMAPQEYKLKFVIIGKIAAGKTSLAKAFISKQFNIDYKPSLGTNIYVDNFTFGDDVKVSTSFYDIAGQSKWDTLRQLYYQGASGAFLVGDLTRPDSFDELSQFWYPDFAKYCPNQPIILLANKCDLEVKTDKSLVEEVAKKMNAIEVVYTSALTGDNCIPAVVKLVKFCIK